MKKSRLFLSIGLASLLIACSQPGKIIIPTSKTLPSTQDNYSIVWVGSGQSYIYENGKYIRSESNDYAFEVVQRRYDNTWHSIKNMHRIHPDYNGRSGPGEQTLFFAIAFSKQGQTIQSKIESSLGNGTRTSDAEFRAQVIQFSVDDVSRFAPYNTMRITQDYQYEAGQLLETVELFKLENGQETPFVKIEEKAVIFRPVTLTQAPTQFK